MGITIFFIIISIVLIVGTTIYVKRNNRLYNFKPEDKITPKKQRRNIKNIWGIDMIKDGVISTHGQNSIIIEIGSIEYRLLNEMEQESIDNILTKICKTMCYKMQFFSTIVKVDTSEKIEEIKNNIQKQNNPKMVEYGEAIIEYLEGIMREDDLFVRKNYLIISSYETFEKAKNNLTEFYYNLKYGLSNIKISCNMLDDGGIIELIHRELNKNSTESIEKIIKEGGLDIYVTNKEKQGKEIINQKQEDKKT